MRSALESGTPARRFAQGSEELALARESFLLSAKPLLYVANIDEAQIGNLGPPAQAVFALAEREDSRAIAICGKVEAELVALSEDDAATFRKELGIDRSGLEYFQSRVSLARRDVEFSLALTLDRFDTRALQERALDILKFKLDVLWQMSDAMALRYMVPA